MLHLFRTIVKPAKAPYSITHADKIMTIGSCFSEYIGRRFEQYKFNTGINPFGQQYNPYSITNAINKLLSPTVYMEADLDFHNELYHSYDHHGSFSKPIVEEALSHINDSLKKASDFFKQINVLFLTFGTAHFFRLKDTGRVVSNCHKMPSGNFEFELMKPDDIVLELEKSFSALRLINPSVKIVLTVSPVRYFAFGHFENSVSKGHLFTAINMLCQKYPDLYYFPAYELVMDDLRDYRFFADDMLHPNKQAIDYVWDALSCILLSAQTAALLKDLDKIIDDVNHSPRNAKSEAHQKFIKSILQKIDKIERESGLDLSENKSALNNMKG